MKVQATLWIIILFLTVTNLFVTVKSRLERNELAALQYETQALIKEWEEQDQARYGIMPNLNPLSLKRGGYPDDKRGVFAAPGFSISTQPNESTATITVKYDPKPELFSCAITGRWQIKYKGMRYYIDELVKEVPK